MTMEPFLRNGAIFFTAFFNCDIGVHRIITSHKAALFNDTNLKPRESASFFLFILSKTQMSNLFFNKFSDYWLCKTIVFIHIFK